MKYYALLENGEKFEFNSELEMYKWLYEKSWSKGSIASYGKRQKNKILY